MNQIQNKSTSKNKKSKKKMNPFVKFFTIFFSIIIAFSILVYVVILATLPKGYDEKTTALMKELGLSLKPANELTNPFGSVKEHTNFIVYGVDGDGTRTDTIIVGCLNIKKNKLDLISIPRDTYVIMLTEIRDELTKNNLWTPSSGEMKINAVHHYSYEMGEDIRIAFATKQIEDLLGIKIEYYALVDFKAFRFIVDSIDGVEFNVPQRMYYNPPDQDIVIDLKPGLQILYGAQAEGLVRYRQADENNPVSSGYADGDYSRMKVQQEFVMAMAKKVLTDNNLFNSAETLFKTYTQYVKTNVNVTDVTKFLKYRDALQNIETHTLPSAGKTIGVTSYAIVDTAAAAELIDKIFYSSSDGIDDSAQDDKTSEEISSKDIKIQVLNGTDIAGLAGRTRDLLNKEGFCVETVGDYSGTKTENTRIFIRKDGYGKDLTEYFEGSEIIIDKNICKSYDIVIILGEKGN